MHVPSAHSRGVSGLVSLRILTAGLQVGGAWGWDSGAPPSPGCGPMPGHGRRLAWGALWRGHAGPPPRGARPWLAGAPSAVSTARAERWGPHSPRGNPQDGGRTGRGCSLPTSRAVARAVCRSARASGLCSGPSGRMWVTALFSLPILPGTNPVDRAPCRWPRGPSSPSVAAPHPPCSGPFGRVGGQAHRVYTCSPSLITRFRSLLLVSGVVSTAHLRVPSSTPGFVGQAYEGAGGGQSWSLPSKSFHVAVARKQERPIAVQRLPFHSEKPGCPAPFPASSPITAPASARTSFPNTPLPQGLCTCHFTKCLLSTSPSRLCTAVPSQQGSPDRRI